MDKNKNSGIEIELIRLVNAHVELVDWKQPEPQYGLGLTKWQRDEDGDHLTVLAEFDLTQDVETPPFRFTCAFIARYSRTADANMLWPEFADPLALAHIIPYLREFVTNMTARLPVPPLMLPPVNAGLLLAAYQARQPLSEPPAA